MTAGPVSVCAGEEEARALPLQNGFCVGGARLGISPLWAARLAGPLLRRGE